MHGHFHPHENAQNDHGHRDLHLHYENQNLHVNQLRHYDHLYLTDLPGYGFAKVSQKEKEKWGTMIENYLNSSEQLRAVFLLVDIRHEPSANDKMMYEWMVYQGFHPIIIATKADKIKRSQLQKQLKVIRLGLNTEKGAILIPFSAETKQGREEIWDLVDQILASSGETDEE